MPFECWAKNHTALITIVACYLLLSPVFVTVACVRVVCVFEDFEAKLIGSSRFLSTLSFFSEYCLHRLFRAVTAERSFVISQQTVQFESQMLRRRSYLLSAVFTMALIGAKLIRFCA